MKSIEIKGKKRKKTGKKSTILLRKSGLIPCVVYGKSEKAIHFFTEEKNLKKLLYTFKVNSVLINLEDDVKIESILQDVQYHPVSDVILHADFYKLNYKTLITMEVPVSLVGRSPGVISGGSLQLNMRKLKLRCLPQDIPNEILININELNIGDKIYVEQIKKKYNYIFLHPGNCVIVSVKISRALIKDSTSSKNEDEKK